MSTREAVSDAWTEVDAWRAQQEARRAFRKREGSDEWRAFAALVPDTAPTHGSLTARATYRVRGSLSDGRLRIERPCSHVPGRWRLHGYLDLRTGTRLGRGVGAALAPMVLAELLVVRDAWLEEGAPRRSRPVEIRYTYFGGVARATP